MILNIVDNMFVFVLGLCVGSFLNCVIYRLEAKEKMTARSFCPKCKAQIKWFDLIPVLSFFILREKCRQCHKKISIQYPVVELATGILFVLLLRFTDTFTDTGFLGILGIPRNPVSVGFLLAISCFLIVIFVYDLKHFIIPDKVLLPAIIIAFAYRFFEIFRFSILNLFGFWNLDFGIWKSFLGYLIAAAVACAFFLVIFLISRGRWIGFGDVKLAVLLGLLLGWPNILAGLFLSFFFGAIIGVGLIIFDKKGLKSEIPFAPFLISGTFSSMLWGEQIINWYLNIIK